MKNERVFIIDDDSFADGAISGVIEARGSQFGHKFIGSASTVEEIEPKLKGLKKIPTTVLLDGMEGRTKEAEKIVRRLAPNAKIIAFTTQEGANYGDTRWSKNLTGQMLIENLTALGH